MTAPIELPDPFGLTADPDGYVPRPATEEALEALVGTLREGRRPAALLGPPGLGKTLLLHLVARRLDDRLRSIYLPYAALPLDELCAWGLSLLGVSQSNDTIGDLTQMARELLSRGSGLLLLVDDAGAMPLPTARKLGDLIASSGGALRLLAASAEGPSASRVLAATGANVHVVRLLEPMSEAETRQYVAARLSRARIPSTVAARFDASTLERIHRLSAGIPRRVHGVASSLLRGGVAESYDEEEAAPPAVTEASEPKSVPEAVPEALPEPTEYEEEIQPEFDLPPWARRAEARAVGAPSARAVFATVLLIGSLGVSLSALRAWLAPPPLSVEPPAQTTRPVAAPPEPTPAQPAPPPIAEPAVPEPAPAPEPEPEPAAPTPRTEAPVARTEPGPAPESAPAPEPAPAQPAGEPRFGTVSVQVNARPWALIQVDGVDLGPTPIAGIPLLAGKHQFRARMPDGRMVERAVEISESNRFVVFE
jgi:type II secretory pathway predicted ATPase ExeA